jgi:putative colanic acid biosynthesis UDP-glucose lipid carrier transferase
MKSLKLKHLLDKVFVLFLIILLCPLFLLIGIAIFINGIFRKEDRGPVLYKEKRISEGKQFNMYKFRTLKSRIVDNIKEGDSATFLQNDLSNITYVGRILVKCYLDELPQLFNIIKGDMSLVGPRPRIKRVYEKDLIEGYSALKYLRGGITGPHQLTKLDYPTSAPEASEEYLKICNSYKPVQLILFDLQCIAKTFLIVLKAKGF